MKLSILSLGVLFVVNSTAGMQRLLELNNDTSDKIMVHIITQVIGKPCNDNDMYKQIKDYERMMHDVKALAFVNKTLSRLIKSEEIKDLLLDRAKQFVTKMAAKDCVAETRAACKYNVSRWVALYLKTHPNFVRERELNGDTALMCAICFNSFSVAELLIRNGAHVEDKDLFGKTVIMRAARANQAMAIKFLIQMGAKINGYSKGKTALGEAVVGSSSDAVKLLLENGAHIDELNNDGIDYGPVETKEIVGLLRNYTLWGQAQKRLDFKVPNLCKMIGANGDQPI